MKSLTFIGALLSLIVLNLSAAPSFLSKGHRIVFLGDSVTHAGDYISIIECELRTKFKDQVPELINLGLPSEGCTGLSEPDHPFPRPNVHERLERAIKKSDPDTLVVCYGMNDGIYYPFDNARFKAYQDGIRSIIKRAHHNGTSVILLTPPAFDPLPLAKQGKLLPLGAEKYAWFSIYEDYDAVMKQYSDWLKTLTGEVKMVIDLHAAMNAYLISQRENKPNFMLSGDGVHVNVDGHRVLADAILKDWDLPKSTPDNPMLSLVQKRQQILHGAWLSHVGHKRPGMKPGKSLKEANLEVEEIDKNIKAAR